MARQEFGLIYLLLGKLGLGGGQIRHGFIQLTKVNCGKDGVSHKILDLVGAETIIRLLD